MAEHLYARLRRTATGRPGVWHRVRVAAWAATKFEPACQTTTCLLARRVILAPGVPLDDGVPVCRNCEDKGLAAWIVRDQEAR